jgi:hypothetical protein
MNTTRTVRFADSDEELFREQMRSAAHGDGARPKTFAYLLTEAAKNGVWEKLGFGSFRTFLEADEADGGLGMNKAELFHAAALADVEDLAHRLYGEDIQKAPPASHAGPGRGHKTNSTTTGLDDRGTEYVIARLKRDDPEMAHRVVSGEISAYAAAREKGWRKPRIVVSSPERVADSLRKHMSTDDLARLVALLIQDERK